LHPEIVVFRSSDICIYKAWHGIQIPAELETQEKPVAGSICEYTRLVFIKSTGKIQDNV